MPRGIVTGEIFGLARSLGLGGAQVSAVVEASNARRAEARTPL